MGTHTEPDKPDILSVSYTKSCDNDLWYLKKKKTCSNKIYVSFFFTAACKNKTHLENKCLIEDRVQCFFVHFGVKLLLLVREEQDFNIRVWGSTWVHGHEICSLKDTNCQLCGENEGVCKQQEQWKQNFIRQKCNFSLRVTASDWLYKPRNPSPQASQLTGDILDVRSFSSVSSNCHSVVTSKKCITLCARKYRF